MIPFNLNTSPLKGINLIDAGAGTGKTYTIEGIFVRLILENQLNVDNILVVTYTEAATNELRERILEKLRLSRQVLLGNPLPEDQKNDPFLLFLKEKYSLDPEKKVDQLTQQLKIAIDTFDESVIFTIHGFCQRVLTDFAFESNATFDVEIVTDIDPYAKEIVQDYWRSLFYETDREIVSVLYRLYATPDHFLNLYEKTASKLTLELEPELENLDFSELLAGTEKSFQKVKNHWQTVSHEIETILSQNDNLSGKSYRKNWMPARILAMNQLFDSHEFKEDKLKWFCRTTIASSVKKGKSAPEHVFFDDFQCFFNDFKHILVQLKKDFILTCRQMLKQVFKSNNLRSFDDLLLDLQIALQSDLSPLLIETVNSKYKAVLIDEFQDTDPVQYFIFSTLFSSGRKPVFFIGDPKQSIYQFRGADIFTYCRAKRDILETSTNNNYNLDTNYRSDKKLVEAINTIFNFRSAPFINKEISFIPSLAAKPDSRLILDRNPMSPCQIWYAKNEEDGPFIQRKANQLIVNACVSEIVRLLNFHERLTIDGEPIRPQDICILVRSHQQAQLIQKALIIRQVPGVIKTKSTIYQSIEFKEILVILEAIVEYNRPDIVKKAFITDMLGETGDNIYSYFNDDTQWESFIEELSFYHHLWQKNGFAFMIRLLMEKKEIRKNLLRFENGERRLTNLLHAIEVFLKAETENNLTQSGLIHWAKKKLMSDQPKDEEEIRLESDENAVKVMTVHVSKGLEFPIVFCPFSWKGSYSKEAIFHKNDRVIFDLGSDDLDKHKAEANEELLAENIRLLYVALTRAKHRCYMVWGEFNRIDNSPLTYLLHNNTIKNKDLWKDLLELSRVSQGTISLDHLPESDMDIYQPRISEKTKLKRRTFVGEFKLNKKLSSYSSLTKKIESDLDFKDRDASPAMTLTTAESDILLDSFHLPKGAKTGVFIHQILEELDFQEKDAEKIARLIKNKRQKYNIPDEWQDSVEDIISSTLNKELLPDFRLNDISYENRISEMEFYFPVNNIQVDQLTANIRKIASKTEHFNMVKTLEMLNFKTTQGFMKGFVDLVFQHQNRYYIVDWKTNHLGFEFSNYRPDYLQDYIVSQAYNLQYTIYLLALHKYLKIHLPGYSFEKNMGGVYYLFLRGISSDKNTGVYFNDLSESFEIVNQMDLSFCKPK